LANLQNQYNQTTDSTAKNQLGAQITDIQNQILGAQADATVKVAQSEMMTQMNGGNSNSNTGVDSNTQTKKLADVQSSENLVKTAYNNGLENLMSYGGDSPDNVQQLDDTYYYTYGNLYMQDRVLQQASMSSIPQIEAMIKNDFLKNIKDSNLKTQLQQSYVSTLTLLCPFAQNKPTACNPISAQ
jgi:hypothetical protein